MGSGFLCAVVLASTLAGALAGCAPPPALSQAAEMHRSAAVAQAPQWAPADAARVGRIAEATLHGPYLDYAGIAIADEEGRILYGRNESRALAPASTMKTIVGAAALATLGADTRLDTSLESLGAPNAEGRIDDLWLVGGGDPVLDPEQLRGGIATLVQRGVRRIDGDLIVDATSFRGPEQNPAWAPDDFEYGYASGTSALSLNWNVIEFRITPTQIGAPAEVRVFPADPSIVIHGSATTGYGTTLRIDRVAAGRNEFTVAGTIAAGARQSYYRPVAGIPLWAGQVAAQMLRERGVELAGTVRLGPDPLAGERLWEHRSPPLKTMVKQMFFESDNHIAEQLLRVLGSQSDSPLGEVDGTTLAGARAERGYLEDLRVTTPGFRIVDASGLAGSDRVAPVTFVRLLAAVARSPIGPLYVSSLPRAGIEGTVRHHVLTAALGRVWAKSGHIADVNALVGFVQTRDRGRLAFAFVVNRPYADDASSIDAGVDRALDGLARL